jgi:hypothetical protein
VCPYVSDMINIFDLPLDKWDEQLRRGRAKLPALLSVNNKMISKDTEQDLVLIYLMNSNRKPFYCFPPMVNLS